MYLNPGSHDELPRHARYGVIMAFFTSEWTESSQKISLVDLCEASSIHHASPGGRAAKDRKSMTETRTEGEHPPTTQQQTSKYHVTADTPLWLFSPFSSSQFPFQLQPSKSAAALRAPLSRKILDRVPILLSFGCLLVSVLLSIFPLAGI